MWKQLFQSHILSRGYKYFLDGRIKSLETNDQNINASVRGSIPYNIEIYMVNNELVGLSCDCPYAKAGSNCKHMAAVLFYIDEKDNNSLSAAIDNNISTLICCLLYINIH